MNQNPNLGTCATQKELIRKHLESGQTLTALQAIRSPFRCINLSGRIAELRKEGVRIKSPMMKVGTGKTAKMIAVYSLVQ